MDDRKIEHSLAEIKDHLQELFSECSDIVIRPFRLTDETEAIMLFVDGLVHTETVNDTMRFIMNSDLARVENDMLAQADIPVSQIQSVDTYKDALLSVLSGDTALFFDGEERAILLGIRGPDTRSISEPETEAAIRGPREGFIENMRTNTSMLRRKLRTPDLKIKSMTIGKRSNTNIGIAYLKSIADPDMVKEVTGRLEKIDVDGIFETGYIEEWIQDHSYSPFPQVQYTERPDTVAANLLEGRVAIIVDGTPFVLLVPVTFWMMVQASEDYYERVPVGYFIRWLRYIFLFIALLTPAFYVAVTTFHQAMIPTTLLLSIAAARESIPFPAVVEALIMEVTFEALREAGIRLPKTVGQAVSILGALVIGQAAVQAGIVSAPMVIVVSITGIASFTLPKFNLAITIRMLRFPFIFAASLFGVFGMILCGMLLLGHMVSLRSFGVPFMAPVAPLIPGDLRDVLLRKPLWLIRRRPLMLPVQNRLRQGPELPEEIRQQGGQRGGRISHDEQERDS
ncbi:spore germination protein [Xylanibacillus composti]|nr:spore germination protein [Xylanibacillus composti]MDT9725832.1 spore germination protein [Xylanibacillus composti]